MLQYQELHLNKLTEIINSKKYIMNKETSMLYADRMQFIVAIMTKDYDKARGIANSRKCIHEDSDITESDSEPSVDSSSSENTDSNTDSGTSSDSDSSADQTLVDDKNTERDLIRDHKGRKIFQRFETKNSQLVFGSGIKANDFQDSGKKQNLAIIETEFRHNQLNGKIIRVLPIRLSDKICETK